ncbi:MAG: carboxypeptidase regulatory-like domain-containing protein [Planctomycetes bacterium]|nr:carboxypeptidase regulatory-like domain-containing protein [Planctomycetota bacterium]
MGLLKLLSRLRGHESRTERTEIAPRPDAHRRCRIERLESRQLMAADIQLGTVYFEPASGTDSVGNTYTVTWQGGAPGTELTELDINLDKNQNGTLDDGECFFNTALGGGGVYGYTPFTLNSLSAGASLTSVQVANGGQLLKIQFAGFTTGDTLVFQIDVDEMGHDAFGNPSVSAVAEGKEFEGSLLTGTFTNPNYQDATGTGVFVDHFDPELAASGLPLPPDSYMPPSPVDETVFTAGTMFPLTQIPLPSSIAGNVYYSINGAYGDPAATQFPIPSVTLELVDASGNPVLDGSGHAITTTTDANGYYIFNNLNPGTYGVREVQPHGYLEDTDTIGSLGGTTNGVDELNNIVLVANNHGVNYNFYEQLPASISGNIVVVTNGDCDDPAATHTPIAGVTLELVDASGNAVLDGSGHAITTSTDALGNYSFTNLYAGTYGVHEVVPAGYIAGCDYVGTINGVNVGNNPDDSHLTNIALTSGQDGVDYNFHLLLPVSIAGIVQQESLPNCVTSVPTFSPLAGVTVELVDAAGNPVLDGGGHPITTLTDASGAYAFTNLAPGTYGVHIDSPPGFYAGYSSLGTVNGVSDGVQTSATALDGVLMWSSQNGIHYDFVVLPPATLAGKVMTDVDGQCDTNPNEPGVAGVEVDLVDSLGNIVATTLTDVNGNYVFTGIIPGTYTVVEVTPAGYYEEDAHPGCNGGTVINTHTITNVTLVPGDDPVNYNFCLNQYATLSGYVFQDGPAITLPLGVSDLGSVDPAVLATHTGVRNAGDSMLAGVTLYLDDAAGNVVASAVTDANGFYRFANLMPGLYTVQVVEPGGIYIPWINTAGTTGGAATAVSIVSINLNNGDNSLENNFSVLVLQDQQFFLPPPNSVSPLPTPQIVAAPPINPFLPPPTPAAPLSPPTLLTGSSQVIGYTWHLSVINAGQPRDINSNGEAQVQLTGQQRGGQLDEWVDGPGNTARFLLRAGEGPNDVQVILFGNSFSTPITGDFNGDGRADVGVFYAGQWHADLNGNGEWDKDDLWAKLGYQDDLPTTGDWDGDGKADFAIFGRAWPGDPNAILNEPGLPNPDNVAHGKQKNMPPTVAEATYGLRQMRRTSSGTMRADLIDHVFLYGTPGDLPIAGNFNGAGIDTIGVFRDGRWDLDMDGDGRLNDRDITLYMGQAGDQPVVGDFDGDGQDELGVYRDGVWLIDINRDYRLDADDMTVRFGGPGDKPVVGDWDGDGRDDLGVFQPGGGELRNAQAAPEQR